MKITQVTKYFYPHIGGIESNVLGISEGLVKLGNDITVFTSNIPKTKGFESFKDIKIFRSTSFFTLSKDPFTPGILLNLLRGDYDLIHLHLPDPFNSVFVWLVSKIKKRPFVITYHADIIREGWFYGALNRIYEILLNRILKDSKRVIITSPTYADESRILSKLKSRDKMILAPNFVNVKKFNPNIDRRECLEKLGLQDVKDKKIILFLGRLVPYKGVEYLINAFPGVKKEVKDSLLLIVGDGPLRENLEKTASDMEDVMIMKRHRKNDDSSLYYPLCDVFVLPSVTRQEAFGISLLEAMACGKPCITTNISGMPYVVDKCGILIGPRNIPELESAIIKILSNPMLSKQLGLKGRERVERGFTQDKVTDKILKIYQT